MVRVLMNQKPSMANHTSAKIPASRISRRLSGAPEAMRSKLLSVFCLKWLPQTACARLCRRRHQPRRPTLAKIRPGSPVPMTGPGVRTGASVKGRYSVRKLIEKYGRKANMMKWREQLNGDCPRRDAHGLHERCDLICPDLAAG